MSTAAGWGNLWAVIDGRTGLKQVIKKEKAKKTLLAILRVEKKTHYLCQQQLHEIRVFRRHQTIRRIYFEDPHQRSLASHTAKYQHRHPPPQPANHSVKLTSGRRRRQCRRAASVEGSWPPSSVRGARRSPAPVPREGRNTRTVWRHLCTPWRHPRWDPNRQDLNLKRLLGKRRRRLGTGAKTKAVFRVLALVTVEAFRDRNYYVHLNTIMVKRGFSVFWWWQYSEFLRHFERPFENFLKIP